MTGENRPVSDAPFSDPIDEHKGPGAQVRMGDTARSPEVSSELTKVWNKLYGDIHAAVDESELPTNVKTEMLIDLVDALSALQRKHNIITR